MTDILSTPVLARARAAADEFLARKLADGSMSPATAKAMAGRGFTSTARTLTALRRSGVSELAVTTAYMDQIAESRQKNDIRGVTAAEFTLAVWGGLQDDLAEWLGEKD